ncbi:triosephosphate isomerase [Marinobacterium zhoushanense]|uniref:Triosephosphate isomerase n=1 Tax=Marinobacterium zhoushanense TaxID=1679163 RepID=A0ABQ1KLL0_9GAMM|nr:triose-phosphate isomerase [Marinobacterium zhoushanense]GGB99949.1 triosephosphate isomerase [Marinobacterium zhoushanense]
MRRALVAGNWKMNGRVAQNDELVTTVLAGLEQQALTERVDVMVFPPSIYITQVEAAVRESDLSVGAQNLCEFGDGAYTGELSAGMLADVGCSAVLIGHSERRAMFGDREQRVAAKVKAALSAGLTPVLCLGESLEQRDAGETLAVVSGQFRSAVAGLELSEIVQLVLAYEPVWAIGTGRTATPEQAQEVHAHLRVLLAEQGQNVADVVRVLYGGSVNADNAAALFAQQDIDGGLIGGASLKAKDFLAICHAAAVSRDG